MSAPTTEALAAAAILVHQPNGEQLRAIVNRVRQLIALKLADIPNVGDADELRRLCSRMVELGGAECAEHSVGSYAVRYVLALKLHAFLDNLIGNPPAPSYTNGAGRVRVDKHLAAYRALGGLYAYNDPNHVANGAVGAALPTLSANSSTSLSCSPFPSTSALGRCSSMRPRFWVPRLWPRGKLSLTRKIPTIRKTLMRRRMGRLRMERLRRMERKGRRTEIWANCRDRSGVRFKS